MNHHRHKLADLVSGAAYPGGRRPEPRHGTPSRDDARLADLESGARALDPEPKLLRVVAV